jgi:hypothetical protein
MDNRGDEYIGGIEDCYSQTEPEPSFRLLHTLRRFHQSPLPVLTHFEFWHRSLTWLEQQLAPVSI